MGRGGRRFKSSHLDMRIEIKDDVLDIVISERNLLTLLTKLYTPGSACEIGNGDVPEGFRKAWLKAEKDDVHYASATRQSSQGVAGQMHPVTEKVLAAVKKIIEDEGYSITDTPTTFFLA